MAGAHRGEKVGDAYVRITADGDAIDDGIKDGFKRSDKTAKEAGGRHAKRYSEGMDDGLRGKFARMLRKNKSDSNISREAKDLGAKVGDWFSGGFLEDGDFSDEVIRRFNRISAFGRNTRSEMHELGQESERLTGRWRFLVRGGRAVGDTFRFMRTHASGFRESIERFDDTIDRYADKTGRAFGRGARNNFINLFGAGVRGAVLLGNVLPKLTALAFKFTDVLGDMGRAFKAADTTLGGLVAAGGAGIRGFSGLAVGAAAAAIGLGALVLIIGPLVSIMTGLVAATVALASSLSFAAVGGVAPLIGLLGPLAAGVGVAALAFTGLDKAQKKALKLDLKPLRTEFRGLGSVARKALLEDIGNTAQSIAPRLRELRPIVRGVGLAIGDIGHSFTNALQSPGYKGFRNAMEDFLPNATRLLGQVIINAIGGAGGVFHSLMPITSRFLHSLEGVTHEFAQWSNSHQGQETLRLFFSKAADSAKSVGRFVREAVVATGKLLDLGRGSGNTLFDDMANSLARFSRYLDANPGAVARWFGNGVDVARGIGNAILDVVGVFRALDTETNRFIAKGLFTVLASSLLIFTGTIRAASVVGQTFVNTLGAMAIGLGAILRGIGAVTPGDTFERIGDSVTKAGRAMYNFKVSTDGAKTSADGAAAGGGKLIDTLDQISGATTRATRAWALNRLQQEGALKISNSFGVSTRDLIDASLGNERALGRVNEKLKAGGPLTDGIVATLRKMGIEVDNTGKKLRTHESDLETWGQALKGIKDKDVRIAIRETGMRPTIEKFRGLIKTQKLTPKQVRIAAHALNVDLTSKQLRQLVRESKNLGNQKPKPKADLDAKPFHRSAKQAMDEIKVLHRQKPIPKADLNARPLFSGTAKAMSEIRRVDRARANPKVSVDVTGFAAMNAALSLIRSFHDKSVTVTTRTKTVGAARPTARGAMVSYAQERLIGEAGPEAVVPLNRPLDQVDPAVRWLSAIAQNKIPAMASGGIVGGGRTVNVGGLTIVTPTKDPVAAATEAVNQIVGKVF